MKRILAILFVVLFSMMALAEEVSGTGALIETPGSDQAHIVEILTQSEGEEMPYVILTKDEYRKLSFYWTKDEKKAAVEYLGAYLKGLYEAAFVSKSKRTKNRHFLLFDFDSGLVFDFNTKYSNTRHGTVLNGNLSSGWVVQYDDLSHTVTYVLRDKKLNIIDHTTGNEFYSDYTLSSRDTAIDALYPH